MDGRETSSPRSDEEVASSSPSYPFLNHNASTLPNNLPPSIDDKTLARQKRKRTSPEDQAVLEAYYTRDPKPDKAARLDLVTKVALGEKEVQIWFQNRRQSSRRKSRPLLPHEIAQYQLSKSAAPSDLPLDAKPSIADIADGAAGEQAWERFDISSSRGLNSESTAASHYVRVRKDPSLSQEDRFAFDGTQARLSHADPADPPSPFLRANHASSLEPNHASGDDTRGWSQPNFTGERDKNSILPHSRSEAIRSPRRVKKASSLVRLSMNSEGGAQVTTKDASSPSPPRVSQSSQAINYVSSAGASSSQGVITSQTSVAAISPQLQRASSGRSRDSRAWEFWCDKSCRTELQEKAEKEASGSAADAIQLLRSASGRSILGAIPAKRNSTLSTLSLSSKRVRRDKSGPLQRSSTSNGRLQGKVSASSAASCRPKPALEASKSEVSVRIPGNESDKENWSPGSDVRSMAEHGKTAESAQPGEQTREFKRAYVSTDRPSGAHRESIDPENDPEIAAFMRAGRESDRVSDHEELDCVQGLLSLSQGNWR